MRWGIFRLRREVWVKRIITIMLSLLLLLYGASNIAYGNEVNVKDILKSADQARGNLEGLVWDIVITSIEDGSKESRGMIVKFKGSNTLARYTSPPNYNDRMVLMVDRNMWFIRSGLSKPVSISPRQRLLGDAANGDIASTNYREDYKAVLLGEEIVRNEPCYVLDLKAKTKIVTYDRIKDWVSKERLVGVHAEFYTISGKLFKIADFNYDNRVRINDQEEIPFVSEMIIRDAIQTYRITAMTYSNIKVQPLPDSLFNLNVLVR
jgi:outer membrane lipoprotein-sorting protein